MPKTQRVLLVEDTEPLARVYIEFLRSEPYEVFHAATGKAALDQLAGGGFDGVVLDLKLPDMDGLDILRHIRAQQMPISVVIVTAHGSVSNAVEAMRQGRLRLHRQTVQRRPADRDAAQRPGTA